jgi:SNF2 family DNA or RNA helicase
MEFKPREHQQMIVDHITSRPASMVIAGMGLGKTSSTLASIQQLLLDGAIRGALIISPLRVTNLTWGNEVAKWDTFSWLVVANLRTEEGQRHWRNKTADVYLINYEQLMTRGGEGFCKEYLLGVKSDNLPVDMVVWDEISKAKSPSSKRIKAFRPHCTKFKYHVGLTGTPTPNGYLDLFAQIRLLDQGKRLGIVFSKYQQEYFESDYMGYKWTAKKGSEEVIQKRISDMTITLRSEDYLDIPDVIVEDCCVNLPVKARKQYKELQKELLLELERGEIEAVNAAVLAGKLMQITGGAAYDLDKNWHDIHDAKLKELAKLRKARKAEGKNMLVIYYFKHELERITKMFPEAEKFTESRMDAWNRGEIPMMLANAQSIGHGLNLQEGAHHMVWFTLTYSRELYDQTNARLARTGQTEKTYISRILCNDTIDDAVAESLREKGETQSGLLLALKNLQTLNSQ